MKTAKLEISLTYRFPIKKPVTGNPKADVIEALILNYERYIQVNSVQGVHHKYGLAIGKGVVTLTAISDAERQAMS